MYCPETQTLNQRVTGSIPVAPTKDFRFLQEKPALWNFPGPLPAAKTGLVPVIISLKHHGETPKGWACIAFRFTIGAQVCCRNLWNGQIRDNAKPESDCLNVPGTGQDQRGSRFYHSNRRRRGPRQRAAYPAQVCRAFRPTARTRNIPKCWIVPPGYS